MQYVICNVVKLGKKGRKKYRKKRIETINDTFFPINFQPKFSIILSFDILDLFFAILQP